MTTVPAENRDIGAPPEGEPTTVSRHAEAREVLGDRGRFRVDRPEPELQDPGALFAEVFTLERMLALVPRIEEIIASQLDRLEESGAPADLADGFARPVSTHVVRALFGLDGPEPHEDAGCRHAAVDNLLVVAGHGWTSAVLTRGTLALLERPADLARVRDDPRAVDPAVEELLRWLGAPGISCRRTVASDTTVGGRAAAAGEVLVVSYADANRDPAIVDDGDVLDLGRRPTPHLAFGHGPHRCPAAPLTRIVLRLAIRSLLRRFPGLRLAGEPALEWNPMSGRVDRLPVAW
jgi:cytochrome P450